MPRHGHSLFLVRHGETEWSASGKHTSRTDVELTPEGDVVAFAHGHLLRVLGARWIGLGAECGGLLGLDTAALCELGFERERRVIWLWNG